MRSRNERLGILGAILGASLLLLATRSHAQVVAAPPVTFKICGSDALEFKAPAGTNRLEVRCPGKPALVMTIAGCVGPHVTRVGVDYTVRCDKMVKP